MNHHRWKTCQSLKSFVCVPGQLYMRRESAVDVKHFFFVLLFQCLSTDCSFTVYANIMSLKFCSVILYFCSISTCCYPLPTVSAVVCVDVNCGVG